MKAIKMQYKIILKKQYIKTIRERNTNKLAVIPAFTFTNVFTASIARSG